MVKALFPVWLVFRREVRDQLRDWRVLFPLFILSVIFPFLIKQGAVTILDFTAQYGGELVGERVVPFFVLIAGFLPVTVSLVIALESFVGEKERGTIEPLLSSPFADWQLYIGKLLAGTFIPLIAGYGAIGFYLLLLARSGVTLQETSILGQSLILTAVQALLMVTAAIAISTQSTSVRAANLLASFIIIPMAILIQGETVLMFWGKSTQILWWAVVGEVLLTGLVVRLGLAHFQRESLLGREIDVLNFRWIWQTFWRAFSGGQTSLSDWYKYAVWPTIKKLSTALIIMTVLGVFGIAFSFVWLQSNLPGMIQNLPPEKLTEVGQRLEEMANLELSGLKINAPLIFWQNVRAIVLMMLAGLFTFGILGVFLFFVNIGLISAVLAFFGALGHSPGLMFALGVLPHGIFELPALFLSAAMVFYMGVVLVTPDTSRTMGEVLIETLADWGKVTLGLVVPLLFVAAIVETYLTPLLLSLYLVGR
ncbi:MAG: stage II sporulation protein M [Candidatus Villigracilaceae bacterium]